MSWNGFYGAYIEYYHPAIYDYREVIIDNWNAVMVQLDSFVVKSTEYFIEAFGDRIDYSMDGNLDDDIEKFKFLDESMDPCDIIRLVVKNEIENSQYQEQTPYTSRKHYQFLRWALEDVWNDDHSWFSPLPDFITKWHQYVMERCRVYPQIMEDRSPKNMFKPREVLPEDYELLGKLSLFLDVDEKKYPEFKKGSFTLVDDFNAKNR